MAARKKSGPETLKAGSRARTAVAAILEALSGAIGTSEAAALLGISLSRYYQLETRALQGMLTAMEPKKRGKQKTPEREIRALKAEKREVEQELRRHQSLLRAANRSLGLAGKGRRKASSKGRATKRGVRGKTVLQTLRAGVDEDKGADDGTAQRDGAAGGSDRGERAGA